MERLIRPGIESIYRFKRLKFQDFTLPASYMENLKIQGLERVCRKTKATSTDGIISKKSPIPFGQNYTIREEPRYFSTDTPHIVSPDGRMETISYCLIPSIETSPIRAIL